MTLYLPPVSVHSVVWFHYWCATTIGKKCCTTVIRSTIFNLKPGIFLFQATSNRSTMIYVAKSRILKQYWFQLTPYVYCTHGRDSFERKEAQMVCLQENWTTLVVCNNKEWILLRLQMGPLESRCRWSMWGPPSTTCPPICVGLNMLNVLLTSLFV